MRTVVRTLRNLLFCYSSCSDCIFFFIYCAVDLWEHVLGKLRRDALNSDSHSSYCRGEVNLSCVDSSTASVVENSSHRSLVLCHWLWLKPCVLMDNSVYVLVCVNLHILHILCIQGIWCVTTVFCVLDQPPFPESLLTNNFMLPFRACFLGLIAFFWTLSIDPRILHCVTWN